MSIVICNWCGEERDTDFEEYCDCREKTYGRAAEVEDLTLEEARERLAFEEEDKVLSELAERERTRMVGFGGEMGC